jgi:outer membrane protein assembly factor BamA
MLLVLAFFFQSFEIAQIQVQGLKRLPQAGVIAASGLRDAKQATSKDLDAACNRLLKTGLFAACSYKYTPSAGKGAAIELATEEAPASQKVRLQIPNAKEEEAWNWLGTNRPLVQRTMPSNNDVIAFYVAAITDFLRSRNQTEEMVSAVDTDISNNESTFIFRPKNAATISEVRFNGNQAIPTAKLASALLPAVKGTPFTEFDIKSNLASVIRPLYEREGHLDVKFPSVQQEKSGDGVAAVITVEEGAQYKLGTVTLTGQPPQGAKAEAFQAGQVANWEEVANKADELLKQMKSAGFLEARYKIERTLNANTGVADATIAFNQGSRVEFGKLELQGLSPSQEERARQVWKIKAGEPMNEGYVDSFIDEVMKTLGPEYSGASSEVNLRPSGKIADVRVIFKRG